MSEIDYTNVKPEELEMRREPRKSTITVLHKPSGQVANDPVVPGALTSARFRRPSVLPKENRVKGMDGYIEGADKTGLYVIITEGDNAKNEYLEKLAADPEALKVSFEGGAKKSESKPAAEKAEGDKPAKSEPTPQKTVEQPAEAAAEEQPAAEPETPPAPPAEATEPVSKEEVEDLDQILADLEV